MIIFNSLKGETMQKINIQELIYDYEKKLLSVENSLFPKEAYDIFNGLQQIANDANLKIEETTKEIARLKSLGKENSDEYKNLINKQTNLLDRHKRATEGLKKAFSKYDREKKEADVKIRVERQKIINELVTTLKRNLFLTEKDLDANEISLTNVENQLRMMQHREKYYNQKIDKERQSQLRQAQGYHKDQIIDLKLAQTFCEEKLANYANSVGVPIDERTLKMREQQGITESPQQSSKTTPEQQPAQDSPKSTGQLNPNTSNLKEKTNNTSASTHKIVVHIKEKDGSLDKEVKLPFLTKTYDRFYSEKICHDLAGDGIMGKIRYSLLKRKLNPNTLRAFDHLEGKKAEEITRNYIESIYDEKPFSFVLTEDLRNLTNLQKMRISKFTSIEELCGAKIMGKSRQKNNLLGEGPSATQVTKPTKKGKKSKNEFIQKQKAEGNQQKVAENFQKNNNQNPPRKQTEFDEDFEIIDDF